MVNGSLIAVNLGDYFSGCKSNRRAPQGTGPGLALLLHIARQVIVPLVLKEDLPRLLRGVLIRGASGRLMTVESNLGKLADLLGLRDAQTIENPVIGLDIRALREGFVDEL